MMIRPDTSLLGFIFTFLNHAIEFKESKYTGSNHQPHEDKNKFIHETEEVRNNRYNDEIKQPF